MSSTESQGVSCPTIERSLRFGHRPTTHGNGLALPPHAQPTLWGNTSCSTRADFHQVRFLRATHVPRPLPVFRPVRDGPREFPNPVGVFNKENRTSLPHWRHRITVLCYPSQDKRGVGVMWFTSLLPVSEKARFQPKLPQMRPIFERGKRLLGDRCVPSTFAGFLHPGDPPVLLGFLPACFPPPLALRPGPLDAASL